MIDTTQLLIDARLGQTASFDRLFDHVYDELRRLARAQLRRKPGSTLHTTELVHEAYLKLFDDRRLEAGDRVHFLSLAARAMRQILVDHFRRRGAGKRGAGFTFEVLEESSVSPERAGALILAMDEALTRLAQHSQRLAKVVEYKFFGGMSESEIGTVLELSVRTVSNDWRRAKAWLTLELAGPANPSDG